MEYLWLILSFIAGVILVILLGWVLRLKTKGLLRILFNSLAGAIVVFGFLLFKVAYLPINPLNALLVGFLGIPGIVLVIVITMLF